jgi:excisionase family DNA binding protein
MEDFLTHKEAAELLKISERTLDTLVMNDNPPPFARVGNQRRYYKEDLILWAKTKKE